MKKIIYPLLTILTLFSTIKLSAQCTPTFSNGAGLVEIFSENFDSVLTKWKMTTYSTPLNRPAPFYRETLITKDNSLGAATDTVGIGTSAFLVSPSMRLDTFTSVNLSFDHICYVAQLNHAQIEYSSDSVNWFTLPAVTYNGPSVYNIPFFTPNTFNSRSNAIIWKSNDSTFIYAPSTMAWVREDFDITPIINGNPNDSLYWFRFKLENPPAAPQGREGTRRWFIDNFQVRGGNCELTPPNIALADPPLNYPNRYQNRVYLTGPYLFDAQVLDNSGIDTVKVIYQVKRDTNTIPNGPQQWALVYEGCIGMNRQQGGNFSARLESLLPNGDNIQVGDTICWMVEAFDGSPCRNRAQDPPVGWEAFQVRPNLPKSCGTQPVFNFPYYQTFDGPAFQVQNPTLLAEDWRNVTGDFHQWAISTGPTSDTGQFRILTDHPGGGKFLYVESDKPNSSGTFKDSLAYLLSPCIDLLDLPNGLVRFYLNLNTAGIEDEIRIDIFDPKPLPNFPDGKFVENVIPPVKGNKGNIWLPFEFSTFPFKGTITQIRFVGTPGRDDGLSDVALDSFKIVPAALVDARLNEVVIGPFIPAGNKADSATVALAVQNLGVDTIKAVNLTYEVTGDDGSMFTSGTFPWTGDIEPGGILNITHPNKFKVPLGQFEIKGWLDFVGDSLPSNDTSNARSRGILYCPIKYMDDFDGDTSWVVFVEDDSLTNSWELGTPNYDFTYSAYTSPNSWDILLNRPYTGTGRTVTLLSPFFDFSTADSIILSFINNRSIDTTKDGMFIEYSLDRGLTWDSLPSLQDSERLRWYNSTLSSGGFGGQPVFSNTTYCFGNTWNGWLESELLLADFLDDEHEVLLRFRFFAEADDDGNNGISLDNIMIYDQQPIDLHSMHYLEPTSSCYLSANQKITSIIKNRGLTPIGQFEMEYRITHIPTNTTEVKTDQYTRTILQRDTAHITSVSDFDMFALGDYQVQIITKIPGDGCIENDTLTTMVEQIDGCEFQFLIATSHRVNFQQACDSTVWRFTYTNGGRNYEVSQAYNWPMNSINIPPGVNDTIDDLLVCIKDGSQVRFDLNDRDTLISTYSLIGFNGEQDTILLDEIDGGPDSPTKFFTWNCPPDLSATPRRIYIDYDNGRDKIQLPVAKNYRFDVNILNNGLDSLDSVRLHFEIDDIVEFVHDIEYVPWLDYNRSKRYPVGSKFLAPGKHKLCTWTSLPNGMQDELVIDDTLCRYFTIMDTIRVDSNIYLPYCDDFEDTTNFPRWISADPYNSNQDSVIFELGTPNKTRINGANSGSNAWATRLDSDYPNGNASALFSPFFLIEKDSCYKVSFRHNFFFADSTHDGVGLKMRTLNATGFNDPNDWITIGNTFGDTLQNPGDTLALQRGWFNRLHILAIPGSDNSGWSGDSKGWTLAENTLPVAYDASYYTALRWRFESDGSLTSEGWAIDDFCIESIPVTNCFPVGLQEQHGFDRTKIYLGQNIPNPAELNTTIPYYIPRAGKVSFVITNMIGQTIQETEFNHPSGDGRIELDVSNMSHGIYFYTMTYEDRRVSRKMIITK